MEYASCAGRWENRLLEWDRSTIVDKVLRQEGLPCMERPISLHEIRRADFCSQMVPAGICPAYHQPGARRVLNPFQACSSEISLEHLLEACPSVLATSSPRSLLCWLSISDTTLSNKKFFIRGTELSCRFILSNLFTACSARSARCSAFTLRVRGRWSFLKPCRGFQYMGQLMGEQRIPAGVPDRYAPSRKRYRFRQG